MTMINLYTSIHIYKLTKDANFIGIISMYLYSCIFELYFQDKYYLNIEAMVLCAF